MITSHPSSHSFRRFILALLLLLALPAAASLDDAKSDWEQGDVDSAIIRLKDLLQQDPDNPQARLLLGRIYLDAAQPLAAEQELTRARDAGAGDAVTRIGLVEALLAQGATSRAMEWADPPENATAAERAELLALRGHILLTQENEAEAAKALSEAIEADAGSLRAMLGLATLELRRGDMNAARASVQQAIEAHPQSEQAWNALAVLETSSANDEAAIDAYTRAVEHARVKWPLRFKRAELHLDLQNIESATADIDAVRSERGEFPGLRYLEGRLALLQGDDAAAVEGLEAYLRAAPSNPRAIYYAALALTRSGRHAQAEEYLLRVTASLPDNPTALTLLARTRLAQGKAAGAEEAIRPLAESADATPLAMEVLRQALARQGRTDEAEALVTRAAERFPELASAQLAYARQLQQSGDVAGSLDLLRQVIEAEPENDLARILLVRGHVAAGDADAAMAAADDFLAAAPESPLAHTAKGALLVQQRDVDAARAAFGKALELDPTFGRAALALAALEIGTDRPEEARRTLDALLEADPENADIAIARAAMARREGGVEAFNARLEDALQRNPEALAVRLTLARSYLAGDDPAAAGRLLRAAPASQGQDVSLMLLSVQADLASGNEAAAADTLRTLAERNPTTASFRYMLASVNARTDDLRAAESNLAQGLENDPGGALEYERLAGILAAQPTAEARWRMLDRLARVAPEHPTLRAAKARLLASQGDYGEAAQMLRELADAYPDSAGYVIWLAEATKGTTGMAAAQGVMRDWLRDHPDNVPVRLALAQFGIEDGDHDIAIEQYRRVLDSNANNSIALNNLAMLLAEERPEEALGYADRALELRPADAAFIDTKGTVLMAKGDYEGAVEWLAKAHAGSTDPSIAFRYAKALAETGDTSAARRVLMNLQTQSFPEKAEATALLTSLAGGD
jgi:putative PEP-CTERM system TPR-repeat lipoprotein